MSDNDKLPNLKEKFKQVLSSTFKVISNDLEIKKEINERKDPNRFDFSEIENLKTKSDFVKARAKIDSLALKKRFTNQEIYKKNLPSNSSCKTLYSIAEKIRCESLGGEMLKGIKKNFTENYNQIISLKRRDQLKSKEDVSVDEAFELYMLKNFHNINLNPLTSKMLDFWEKDFNQSINQHIKFLKDNLEDQNKYSSKLSEILAKMDIFQSQENEEDLKENNDDGQSNPSDQNEDSQNNDDREQDKKDELETSGLHYDIDEYKLDEQLVDNDLNDRLMKE